MPKYTFVCAAICLAGLVSCGPQMNIKAAPEALSSKEIAIAESLHYAVNSHRSAHGVGALTLNPTLNRYATLHSQYLRANPGKFTINGPNISHDGFEMRYFILKESQVVGNLGENVARAAPRNTDMANHLVKLWAGSRRHEENMLQDWSLSGIGIAVTPDDAVYATLLLGTEPHRSQRDLTNRIRVHF